MLKLELVDGEVEGILKLRCTDVELFLLCPYRFYLAHVGLPTKPTPAAVRGTLLHALLEKALLYSIGGVSPDSIYEVLNQVDPDDKEWLVQCLQVWSEEVAPEFSTVYAVEEKRYALVEIAPGVKVLMVGKVDVVAEVNGVVRVIDYKSSYSTYSEQIYALQPVWYAALWLPRLPVEEVGIYSWSGKKNVNFNKYVRKLNEGDFMWLYGVLLSVVGYLSRGYILKSYVSCTWCDWRDECKTLPNPLDLRDTHHMKLIESLKEHLTSEPVVS